MVTTVFISYSHDSPAHAERVLKLADRLREQGLDCELDQYQESPPEGWPRWMERQLETVDYVLVVCTETYLRRAKGEEPPGAGRGVKWEATLSYQHLYDADSRNTRFIPVLFESSDTEFIPKPLGGATHYCVADDAGYDRLYRRLTDQKAISKPSVGAVRTRPVRGGDGSDTPTPAGPAKTLWHIPHSCNPFFTGREAILEQLHQRLAEGAVAVSQPQAISGLGGIGKTQTALAYACRHRDDYRAVLWLAADSHEALTSGFAGLARVLDLPEQDAREQALAVAASKRWLAGNDGWLLVLDNLDDPGLAGGFLPSPCPGQVLITSRARAFGELAEPLPVDTMSAEEGALLLLRRSRLIGQRDGLAAAAEPDREQAEALAGELGGLPLAIDQAGAYIEETATSLAEYRALYRDQGQALRAKRGELAGDHDSVTLTFQLAFEKVAAISPAAGDLLRLCAFLHPDAIPEELLDAGADALGETLGKAAAQPLERAELLRAALRYSLLDRDGEDHGLSIHRLVQAVLRDGMDEETRRAWAERAVRVVNAAFPEAEFSNWPRCERLLPQAQACAELIERWGLEFEAAGRLLNGAAMYLYYRARYVEAELLYQRALGIRAQALGPDHPDVAASLNNLGLLYDNQGRYAEAELLHQRALGIQEQALGPDHSDVATSLNNLAILYCSQGRYAEAEPLHRRALGIREQALGPDLPDVATSLNNLAELYRAQGRYAEAEPLHQRALGIREQALGLDHSDVAQSLNNLATLYDNQGRYTEADPLYQRALGIREQALGLDHPDVAQSLNNLAGLYQNQGCYAEAEPLYQRALGIQEQVLGPDHPDVATSLNNLAELYRAQGRYAEAESLQQRALGIKEKALGPDHPAVATSLNNLAALYDSQGRYTEAEPLYQRALGIWEQALGRDHPDVAASLNNLAMLYYAQGEYPKAAQAFERIIAILERALGARHPKLGTAMANYALILTQLDRGGEAAAWTARAEAIKQQVGSE